MNGWEGACCHTDCHARICLSAEVHQRAKRTHEWFYCSAGHRQHFTGPTPLDEKIARLEQWLADAHKTSEYIARLSRTCLWPACEFVSTSRDGLVKHMQRIHGMPTLAAVREAEAG